MRLNVFEVKSVATSLVMLCVVVVGVPKFELNVTVLEFAVHLA